MRSSVLGRSAGQSSRRRVIQAGIAACVVVLGAVVPVHGQLVRVDQTIYGMD